jgi:hypothetical protein
MVFGIVFTHKKTNVTRDKMTPPSKCLSVVVKRPGMLISRSVATVLSCKANAHSSLLGLSWVLLIISLESIMKVIGSSALLSYCCCCANLFVDSCFLSFGSFVLRTNKRDRRTCRGIKAEKSKTRGQRETRESQTTKTKVRRD